ncbi:MAG: excinuclease ABC subunit UvrC [Tannerella sp.]|jgi:excinuclease ABC subunit C|nr:excinuclease ABC subunit UvrC [Tannerella sp.]
MNDRLEYLLSILSTIPENPGCYQYFDEKGMVLYVGKAKNLKKRISSYFRGEQQNSRTRALVNRIYEIKYVIVDTEDDALLLENNLIKQYRPRYNVLLKDDKTYPSIVIKKEPFPRIFQTRKIIKDGSSYFGPYASAYTAKLMLQLIKTIYPIRSCNYSLTPEEIKSGRHKLCLDYHIKRCKGPCQGLQTEEDYNKNVTEIKEILKGDVSRITRYLLQEIDSLEKKQRFEDANAVRKKYELIENFRSKSTVVTPTLHNIDVFSLDENEQSAYINFMHVGNGAIVQVYTIEYRKKINETKKELLELGIVELRKRFGSDAPEIIVPFLPDISIEKVKFTVPRNRGDAGKRKLLELSLKNAKQFKFDRMKQSDKLNPEQQVMRILKTIQHDLQLPALPEHIECFDNSNIQGTTPVAACVVFKMAKPSKKEYRHFHIKTVVGPDDFASMEEVVRRRYTRLKEEQTPLPQLIVIDGGKGQLHVATDVLRELGLLDQISVVGLAKRMEEVFFPGNPTPLVLDKNSETLRVIQHLRNEAHRFAITFHRFLRSKNQIQSELDTIKGVGSKTKELLLKKYRSVKRIREVSLEELSELIGKGRAEMLLKGLQEKK